MPMPLPYTFVNNIFLRPANEVYEGYVFTSVCLSTGGMSAPLHAGIHPQDQRQTPPGQTPPAQCMLGYGQQAGGTHPTGMHSFVDCHPPPPPTKPSHFQRPVRNLELITVRTGHLGTLIDSLMLMFVFHC